TILMRQACCGNRADPGPRHHCLDSAAAVLRARRHWGRRTLVLVTEIDPTLGQIIGGHFYFNTIAGKNSNSILFHPARFIRERVGAIGQPDPKACVRKQLQYGALKLDKVFLSQRDLPEERGGRPLGSPPGDTRPVQTGRKFTAETRPRWPCSSS